MQINTYDLVRTFEYWTYRGTIISVCVHNNINRSIYLAHCKQINDLPRLLMLLIDVQLGIRHIASSKVFAVLHAALLQSAFHLRFLCATQRFTTYLSQLEYSTNSHEKKVYCIKMWKRPTLLHYFVQNFELPENQYAREYSFINIDVRSEWIEIRADVYIFCDAFWAYYNMNMDKDDGTELAHFDTVCDSFGRWGQRELGGEQHTHTVLVCVWLRVEWGRAFGMHNYA